MSIIRPFRGLRPPTAELAAEIASPPYDVLDSKEARQLARGKEKSFLHVVKPEIDLEPDIDLYDDRVYAKAAENLARFMESGYLVQDEKPHVYLYKQRMGDHEQTGVVACVSVDEYENGLIKKHELTRKDKEDDRTRHVDETNCNAGPVFLTYRSRSDIDGIVDACTKTPPVYDFTADDGIGHTFWVVDDEAAAALVNGFAGVPCLYVADGHHRTASGARVRDIRRKRNPGHTGEEEYNFFMAVIFPHDQLKILDYNRAVADLNGMTCSDFLGKVMERFDVAPATGGKPSKAHEFGMFLNGSWHRLTAREGTFDQDDPVGKLDVSILQNNLLDPILGIDDPRTNDRIKFIGGIRGMSELERLVNEEGFAVAFALHPTSIEELMDIADAGMIMPPKSTWFEPKLRSGLVVHLLD